MKLYSVNLSPYSSRVRIAIYAKELPVEISYPPATGLKSPEYLAINPIGKLPCLVTEGGWGLPESGVILEYLEERHPERPLMPASPEERAKVRLVSRIGELYVTAPGHVLFGQLNPRNRDQGVVDAQIEKLDEGLSLLDRHLGDGDFAVGDSLTLADCTIVPALAFLPGMTQALGRPEVMERHPKVMRYIERVRQHPAVAKVLEELEAAMGVYQKTGQFT